jgi:hypothetical protein
MQRFGRAARFDTLHGPRRWRPGRQELYISPIANVAPHALEALGHLFEEMESRKTCFRHWLTLFSATARP